LLKERATFMIIPFLRLSDVSSLAWLRRRFDDRNIGLSIV